MEAGKWYWWIIVLSIITLQVQEMVSAGENDLSEVMITTDKDTYVIGETVEIRVSMHPNITCLCLEHEWEVVVVRVNDSSVNDSSVVERWNWRALANESGFRDKILYWTPSEVGEYKIVATLVTHNASASKVIEVIGGRAEVEEYVYRTDDYDLKIVVPRYLVLSTPQNRTPNRIDVFLLKKTEALSGYLGVSLEGGVKVIIEIPPTTPLWVFLDVDLTVLGIQLPDRFQLKWPIPLPLLDLEEGYTGVYTSLIPVKPAKIQLETIPVGEWRRIGSYNLYVNIDPEYLATLGQLPADKTGAVVASTSEEVEDYKELYESLLQEYNVLKGKCDALEDENKALKSKISDLEGTISRLREEVSSLKNQVASLQQALSQTEEALNEAKNKLTIAENELAWWRMFTLIVGTLAFAAGLAIIHITKTKCTRG